MSHDAILIVGFGGPERREDVLPFLESVTKGRNIPRARLLEVATHYDHFGGVSPINQQVRDLLGALRPELDRRGLALPVFWGNRNWHPFLADTMRTMTAQGVRRALAVVLAAYSSYSSCRQYLEDIARARQEVGPDAPLVDKVRAFFNHPDFLAASAARVGETIEAMDPEDRKTALVLFTAHSIPVSMAQSCAYEEQLQETCRLIAAALGLEPGRWRLAYQSRSGRPQDPWLGPDILEDLRTVHGAGVRTVVIHPVGFLSDHVEVLYDLDEEARRLCDTLGMKMARAGTVGTHPAFVRMLGELIEERAAR